MKTLAESRRMLLIAVLILVAGVAAAQDPLVAPVTPTLPPPGSADFLTPLTPEPIPIDQALEGRVRIVGKPARKVILFICDGMAASALTFARALVPERRLELDRFPVVGRVIGKPVAGEVNDSAAAGSALSTGFPGRNGQVALDDQGEPRRTLFEEVRQRGFRVGLVSDTRLSHATPAAFGAHVPDRADEAEIARQLLQSGFDVMLSGGLQVFLPAEEGGRQPRGRRLLDEAAAAGYTVARTRDDLVAAASRNAARVLGLFAPSFLPYRHDPASRDGPGLPELTAAALTLLDRGPNGFLLMVEAGLIDPVLHQSDPAELLAQMQEMDKALRVVADFTRGRTDALVVVVSDHGTGGLQITGAFAPDRFLALATSTIGLAARLDPADPKLGDRLSQAVPGLTFTEADLAFLRDGEAKTFPHRLGDLVGRRLGLAFLPVKGEYGHGDADGHTGEDLFLHALGCHQGLFGGVTRQTDIPRRLAAAMGLRFP
ncbi:MAG: hypothetical protein GX442_18510 [Candidatus Riflebacteria bacterium]|nr:hypothetical protein [Candidatus Riflebacteria bacterium]